MHCSADPLQGWDAERRRAAKASRDADAVATAQRAEHTKALQALHARGKVREAMRHCEICELDCPR